MRSCLYKTLPLNAPYGVFLGLYIYLSLPSSIFPVLKTKHMIARIWHGYTTHENADTYENLLRTEVFHEIESKDIAGFKEITLLRRMLGEETEFITIMYFDTLDAVREFAGEEFEQAFVPQAARDILKRFDNRSQHYHVVI